MPFEKEHLGSLLRSFKAEYFDPRTRVTCPLNRGYLSDPLPPLARIVRVFNESLGRRRS
jgi:hypothetical protein